MGPMGIHGPLGKSRAHWEFHGPNKPWAPVETTGPGKIGSSRNHGPQGTTGPVGNHGPDGNHGPGRTWVPVELLASGNYTLGKLLGSLGNYCGFRIIKLMGTIPAGNTGLTKLTGPNANHGPGTRALGNTGPRESMGPQTTGSETSRPQWEISRPLYRPLLGTRAHGDQMASGNHGAPGEQWVLNGNHGPCRNTALWEHGPC